MIQPRPLVLKLNRFEDIGSGRNGILLLDKNERTVPYADSIVSSILRTITPFDLTRYPDQSPLYKKLSSFLGIPPEQILLSNGADSGLKIFFETFVSEGDEVLFLDPTYAMVNVYSEMYGCTDRSVAFGDTLELDPSELISAISNTTKAVIVANPNQPTGTLFTHDSIKALLKKTAECNALLIVDEAYIEFSGQRSALEEIKQHSNLCVLRTFSKAWGLAGVRLGFVAAPEQLIRQMKKVKPLLDINIIAIRAATYLIDHHHLIDSYVNDVKEARDYLIRELQRNEVDVFPSNTNFLHVRPPVGTALADIETTLTRKGYRFRFSGGSATILDGCLRLTIGPKEQMRPVLRELLNVFQTPDATPDPAD